MPKDRKYGFWVTDLAKTEPCEQWPHNRYAILYCGPDKTLTDLAAFADQLAIPTANYSGENPAPHYTITRNQRKRAIRRGAQHATAQDVAEVAELWRQRREAPK